MASTASDLIKFEKMTTGEKSGTWGTLANQSMSRLEEAICDITNISLASLGGANYTLDDTQYLEHDDASPAQESHVAVIKATGTMTANEKIIVPLRNKTWWIWNATGGAYAVTVGGATGNTVTVPQGYQMNVVCDGTNVEALTGPVDEDGDPRASSATVKGVVELATDAETVTGSDTARATTPANVTAKMAAPGTIGGTTPAGATFTTIKGDTSLELATGATVTGILDEDAMGSDSATELATQQSIKAYVDALQTHVDVGQHTIWMPAGAMEAAVTTAAATSNAVEVGTSLFAARTMDFVTGSDNYAYFGIQMPKSWDAGALVCQFVWSATGANANTVLWGLSAISLADDEVLTTAFGAPTTQIDTNSTTADDIMISPEVSVTVGSTPTAEDYLMFEVMRDVSGDELAEDARLHGIKIHYTTDTGSDS